ncbi:TonB-dependent receptor [Pelagicoccus sp. SDUM812005]|uniref:TonB-dependent siderophore receptor n=1 Tax=Pelagicoccus sp. SDUM812005 TaxID=3041257 RepID=UPI00280C964B|nr:TonB-dependent receptor [Pelagicoccus sp. SDUM812005]MDQ8183523.1 TonB-dependent receptor [Pelagicoccus sp. SDUM812005]
MNLFENHPFARRHSSLRIPLRSVTLLGLFVPALLAQEAEEQEIFELSPFTVDASKDQGWRAGSTLTGSRTNQALKNVPISVDPITAEFIDDLGIEDLTEANSYMAGLDTIDQADKRTDDNRSSYRGLEIGGRENAQSSRNFFMWYAKTDTYNVSRIDVNKGSNSLMFGDASPGGQSTVFTKRAMFSDLTEFRTTFDSEGSYRYTVDVNRQITDQLAIRLNGVKRSKESYLDFGKDDLQGYDVALTYKPFDKTEIRFEFEDLKYNRIAAGNQVGIRQVSANGRGFTSSTRWYYTTDGDLANRGSSRSNSLFYESDGAGGFLEPVTLASSDRSGAATGNTLDLVPGATALVYDRDDEPLLTLDGLSDGVNTYGTGNFLNREINNYSFWLDQRVGDLSLQLSMNRQEQYQNRNDGGFGSTLSVDADGRIYTDGDLDSKVFGNDVNSYRFSASYPLHVGDWMSQYLVGSVDYQDEIAYSFRSRLVNRAAASNGDGTYDYTTDLEGRHRITVRAYLDDPEVDLRDPDFYAQVDRDNLPYVEGIMEPIWVNYAPQTSPYYDKRYSKSASFSANGSYFNGRLRSLLGIRYDKFRLKRMDLLDIGSSSLRQAAIDQYGEAAYWGQDVNLGTPDEAPEHYSYLEAAGASATTGNAGLVYKVNENYNVYATVSDSFRWQDSVDFLGNVLGPQEGSTKELGLKGDFMDNKLSVTAAVYDIKRENVPFTVASANNHDEMELLYNDTTLSIDTDGTIIYTPVVEGDPGFVDIETGLNNEWRTHKSSERSRGAEVTFLMQRTQGLQARLALSYIDVDANNDLDLFTEMTLQAEAREAERAAFLAEHWENDPNYEEGELPEAEEDLRGYLDEALDIIAEDAGNAIVDESRARPYSAKWLLDYQFGKEFFLPKLRVMLSGQWRDNYYLDFDTDEDGNLVEFIGGSQHPVTLSFQYKTKLDKRNLTFDLRFRNLVDLENKDDLRDSGGFVNVFTDELVYRQRKIAPPVTELSVRYKF